MKIKKLVLAAVTAVMVFGMAMNAYASGITTEYKSWYYDTFGNYPNGGLSYWVTDPAFYKYLGEYGDSDGSGYYYYEDDGYYYFTGTGSYGFYDYDSDSGYYYDDTETTSKYYAYVTDAYWSGKTAKWSIEGKASKYQVRLYRNGTKVATYNTKGKSYSFSSDFTRSDYYYFEVRAYNSSSGWSEWVDSEDKYFSATTTTTTTTTSSAGPSGTTTGAKWVQATDGTGRWWYRHADGTYKTNGWEQIDGKWYYFDATGWMKTGWITWSNGTYYLGSDGAMVTGYQTIGGVGHNFSPDGALIY
jgi:hypothetical protein